MKSLLAIFAISGVLPVLAGAGVDSAHTEPHVLHLFLNDMGRGEMPDFSPFMEKDVTNQIPVGGTHYTRPQDIPVQLRFADGSSDEFTVSFHDIHPPELAVDLVSQFGTYRSPDNYRYVVDDLVLPVVGTSDNCGSPSVECRLNSKPYVLGTPIVDRGFYSFDVQVTDDSGNRKSQSIFFEIRDSYYFNADIAIEHWEWNDGAFRAEIILEGEGFDWTDIDLGSVDLGLRNKSGGRLPVNRSTPQRAATTEDRRSVLLVFSGTAQADQEPVALELFGTSAIHAAVPFDFRGKIQTETAESSDGVAMQHNDPVPVPGTTAECRWRVTYEPEPVYETLVHLGTVTGGFYDLNANDNRSSRMPFQYGCITINDPGGRPTAHGEATDRRANGAADLNLATFATVRIVLKAFPSECCNECKITVDTRPNFLLDAYVNDPAESRVAAMVQVTAGNTGVNAIAAGGLHLGSGLDDPTYTITVGVEPSVEIPITVVDQDYRETHINATGPKLIGTTTACEEIILINSNVDMKVKADAWPLIPPFLGALFHVLTDSHYYAHANAGVTKAALMLNIVAEMYCTDGHVPMPETLVLEY